MWRDFRNALAEITWAMAACRATCCAVWKEIARCRCFMSSSRWRALDRADEKSSRQTDFRGRSAAGAHGRMAGLSADPLPTHGAAGGLQSRRASGESRDEMRGLPLFSGGWHVYRDPGTGEVRGLPCPSDGVDDIGEALYRQL